MPLYSNQQVNHHPKAADHNFLVLMPILLLLPQNQKIVQSSPTLPTLLKCRCIVQAYNATNKSRYILLEPEESACKYTPVSERNTRRIVHENALFPTHSIPNT